MKRFIIFVILIFIVQLSKSQIFKGEIILGGNVSQVDGDEVYGYRKMGFNTGLGVMYPFSFKKKNENKNWGLSMEILFNQKGSYQANYTGINYCDTCPPEMPCDSTIKYKVKMQYVSIPIMLNYTDKTGWSIGLGLAYNRLAGLNEIVNGIYSENIYSISTIISPNMNKIEDMLKDKDALFAKDELSMIVDVRCRIWQQLKLNFRFEYSLFPIGIRKFYLQDGIPVDPYIRKQYNNLLSLRLIYMLNEPKVIIEKKRKVKREENKYYY